MRFFHKIKSTYRLLGLKFTLLKLFKSALYAITSFRWEKCYLMSKTLESAIDLPNQNYDVRLISLDDYDDNWKSDYLIQSRYEQYRERFKRDDAVDIGCFIDGKLAYSTWVLFNGIEINGKIMKKDSIAFLWDSYCYPLYRGRGLHNYMNAYSLNMMLEKDMEKGGVIVLSSNRPAIKTQLKCGMSIECVFYTYKFMNKKYSSLNL